MPENVLGHLDPIFYNLQCLPKRLVSFLTSVKEASVWQTFFYLFFLLLL